MTEKYILSELEKININSNNLWKLKNNCLRKQFSFSSFKQVINYMQKLVNFCNEINHHPNWSNNYKKLNVNLTTHNISKLSKLDFQLAKQMDKIFITYQE